MARARKKLHKPKRMDSISKNLKRILENNKILIKLKSNGKLNN